MNILGSQDARLSSSVQKSPSSAEKDTRTEERVKPVVSEEAIKTKKGKDIDEKSVIEAIEKANKALKGMQTNLQFSIHEKTKQIMVKVMNSETNEVIRELPPEKVLDMVAKMWEIAGLFVDEKR
ncbi:flagellar protein FlaG [Ammoniphilus sp. 3BR4]|uniref:flagellar protein FlaG n=1 Tax=Ammoniphilus sp. 3BR4 TaxID=3158265 RepID=UPI003467C90B